jgi:molybdate transport system ATP-binding protein
VLHADLSLRLGDLDLRLELRAVEGETVALLGPNGAGKTTALRALAGLAPLDAGRIELDGVVVDEPAAGTFVPTGQRPIGVVFQDHVLFPRLSALDNVAFGLRARGRSKGDARTAATGWLERLGVAGVAAAKPRALSGGEAQKVALARALAIEPRLLLLDEPLAALDAGARVHVRAELRAHLAAFGGARVLVTHDPLDAVVLADRIVVVEGGRAVQSGTPADLTARPATRFVADLVGVNLLIGRAVEQHTVELPGGARLVVADALLAGEVALAVRPQAVGLHGTAPGGSPRNAWATTVTDVEAGPERVRVTLGAPIPITAEVTPGAVAELGLAPGAPVWAAVKAVDVRAYER